MDGRSTLYGRKGHDITNMDRNRKNTQKAMSEAMILIFMSCTRGFVVRLLNISDH